MRKIIAAINVTIDGFCDHTVGIPDEKLHDHYTALLEGGGVILYGRTTYELMGYWQTVLANPTGEKSMDDFAKAIDRIPKIVFSRTMKSDNPKIVNWPTAQLATLGFEEQLAALKQQPGNDIFIGSPSLIDQATRLDLIDELQLAIHPVVIGKGLQLFKAMDEQIILKLTKTKTMDSGVVIHYYGRAGGQHSA